MCSTTTYVSAKLLNEYEIPQKIMEIFYKNNQCYWSKIVKKRIKTVFCLKEGIGSGNEGCPGPGHSQSQPVSGKTF